jgi:GTPase SAR1 family protein
MPGADVSQLELLAEMDALAARLDRWAQSAPDWQPAETCRAMVGRLRERVEGMRIRWEAPLVVATLGGSGSGKSALVNALLGEEVVRTGKQRPTTMRPTLVCRPDITPEMLSIDAQSVEVTHRDLPILRDLVLLDCPDPDTTEEESASSAANVPGVENPADSNLARLRKILPHCDVLMVATTQQKYRSARVAEELATAASGAKLVFVQTHADCEDDIRADWHRLLTNHHEVGHIFLIDSLAALADAKQDLQPRGEFADLIDLLRRQLAGAAAARIRRANFLDLLSETLECCARRLDDGLPAIEQVQSAVAEQRGKLAAILAGQMNAELLSSRRPWENRLLQQTTARWGLSPFSLVLRIYQGFGTLAIGALLFRARTPAQMALWGTLEGVRALQRHKKEKDADRSLDRLAAGCWDDAEVRRAAMILEGYAAEAGLSRQMVSPETVRAEAEHAGSTFIGRASAELESLVARLAARHTGWFTRWRYEFLFLAMLGWLLFRLGKNFFWDSDALLNPHPTEAWGLNPYLAAGFWIVLWCLLLLWMFAARLRRGLRRQLDQLAESWRNPSTAAELFSHLDAACRRIQQFRGDLQVLEQEVRNVQTQLAKPG